MYFFLGGGGGVQCTGQKERKRYRLFSKQCRMSVFFYHSSCSTVSHPPPKQICGCIQLLKNNSWPEFLKTWYQRSSFGAHTRTIYFLWLVGQNHYRVRSKTWLEAGRSTDAEVTMVKVRANVIADSSEVKYVVEVCEDCFSALIPVENSIN